MTREEAINILNRDDDSMRKGYFCINDFNAIEVLKSEESILDKIRDEILKLDDADYDFEGYYKAVTDALAIIDKYRGEVDCRKCKAEHDCYECKKYEESEVE